MSKLIVVLTGHCAAFAAGGEVGAREFDGLSAWAKHALQNQPSRFQRRLLGLGRRAECKGRERDAYGDGLT
ncbi:hypothetical protein [Paucibacter soli]|uniref:hypothetical protein n=1 Tax=Paucibacter soli TaxID=3133433 RepID=UPI00309DE7A1